MIDCKSGRLLKKKKGGKEYWYARLNLRSIDPVTGKTSYSTKDICTEFLAKRQNESDAMKVLLAEQKKYIATGDLVLVSKYVTDWVESRKHELESTTYEGYQYRAVHICEYFDKKHMSLGEVTPEEVRNFYSYLLLEAPNRCPSRGTGLSNRSVKDICSLFRWVMSDAQAMGHIKSDPTLKVRIPQKKENKIKKPYVAAEQVGIFLEEVKGHRLEVPFLFGLYFGLRREEICGIRWSAIRDNRLFIEHTVVRLKTRVAKDRTKTKSSARDYPLSPEMIDLLKKIRDKQDTNRRYFGNTYVESDYVFTWEDGRPYDPDYLTRGFKKLVKGSDKLDDALTLHSLRASCVSLLIHAGVDIKSIQDWTGHKDVQTMLGVYARMSEKDKSLVENRMNSLVFGDSSEGQESRTGDYENRDS